MMIKTPLSKKNKIKSFLAVVTFTVINLLTSITINATEVTVNSISDLQTAINNSSAGDVIILANGSYINNSFNINRNSITVKAATPGGVFLNGTNSITISGNNVTFSGFQFTSGIPIGTVQNNVIVVTGNYVTVTQLNFSGYNGSKYINLQGQYDNVTYCNFENKPVTSTNNEKGNMIHIAQRTDLNPNYAKIRFCSFKNMPGSGGDYGNECIRITNHEIAEPGTYQSKTIVEYCYFTNTGSGDSEAISVKSDNNIIRYNTMVDNQTANFCFRYGDDNVAYGNFFINSGGIRIKESNNIHCYNNYFENCGNGSSTAPVIFEYDGTSVVSHLNDINIVNNTFVGGSPIQLGTYSTPSNGGVSITTFTNNTFANNIFKYTTGTIFSGSSTTGISWAGNIRQGNLGTINPASGIANNDPLLITNSEGYYGIPSNSPAINTSSSNYPSIIDIVDIDDDPSLNYDISRQTRDIYKDVGCDEYTTGVTTNHPLGLAEVGPSYLVITEPTATSPQTFVGPATVANLVANGTALKWYATQTGGTALSTGVSLANGATYYVSQTLNNCESARTAVSVIIETPTQTINFPILPLKYTNSTDFSPGATSSNSSAITYSSSNTAVATIVNNKIHIVAKGTSNITASSSGAAPVTQQLIVQCSCVQN